MTEKKHLNGYVVGGYGFAIVFSLLVWAFVYIQVAKLDDHDMGAAKSLMASERSASHMDIEMEPAARGVQTES